MLPPHTTGIAPSNAENLELLGIVQHRQYYAHATLEAYDWAPAV